MKSDAPPCHLCGKESVMEVDGKAWCEGCLHAVGSCCGESEMDCENPPDAPVAEIPRI